MSSRFGHELMYVLRQPISMLLPTYSIDTPQWLSERHTISASLARSTHSALHPQIDDSRHDSVAFNEIE